MYAGLNRELKYNCVMKKICLFIGIALLMGLAGCNGTSEPVVDQQGGDGFTFAFMTDLHVQPEKRADEGVARAIEKVNELGPDFVITGGDLIMDALGQTQGRSDSLYRMYDSLQQGFEMPVYNTLGNHELFGIYERSGVDRSHPLYGEKMYEKYLGKPYYAFDHKGWRFYIFDSVDDTGEGRYYGHVDSVQLAWLKEDLEGVDPETPLAVSVHIPLITAYTQISKGSTEANSRGLVVENSREVLDAFGDHNLKLVLQGHLHILEDIYIDGIHFITGGAVSANWWSGPRNGMEEGFLVLKVHGEELEWKYVDFGWEAG